MLVVMVIRILPQKGGHHAFCMTLMDCLSVQILMGIAQRKKVSYLQLIIWFSLGPKDMS